MRLAYFCGISGAGLVLAAAWTAPVFAAGDACLRVSLVEKNRKLSVFAGNRTVSPDRAAGAIARDFRTVYEHLENVRNPDPATLQRLGQEILQPLADLIGRAPCLVFVIQPRQLYFALDLLPLGGRPLYVQKPLAYAFSPRVNAAAQVFGPQAQGLILRDPDTDPENGAGEAARLYTASKLELKKQSSMKIFRESAYDFVLISGHGSVTMLWDNPEDADDDSIGWKGGDIIAEHLGRVEHRLVYLDSCQLGVSHDFIEASRDAGAKFFLAPITSNEAGHSSTRTIRYFFSALRAGQNAPAALFTTRTQLHAEFVNKTAANKLLYYAFPFRLYLL